MGTSPKQVHKPTRKDLVIFALMLPVFTALLGWLSVRRPGGLRVALTIVTAASLIAIVTGGKKWKERALSLFIPFVLLAFMVMGTSTPNAARLAGSWAVIGAALGAAILLAPKGDAIYSFWLESAEPIGLVISTFVLALGYYLIFTPVGWLMRTLRNDPMGLKYDRAAATYWVKHEPVTEQERYFRQF
jgi:hypothetical protein